MFLLIHHLTFPLDSTPDTFTISVSHLEKKVKKRTKHEFSSKISHTTAAFSVLFLCLFLTVRSGRPFFKRAILTPHTDIALCMVQDVWN